MSQRPCFALTRLAFRFVDQLNLSCERFRNTYGGGDGPDLIESVCLADSDIEDCLATSRAPTLFDERLKSL